MIKEYPH